MEDQKNASEMGKGREEENCRGRTMKESVGRKEAKDGGELVQGCREEHAGGEEAGREGNT